MQILGFNWAEQLAEFIDDMMDKKVGFAVQKYRSAIFYHNYSVRQMRIESEIDGLIKRKQTQLNKKLRKLDRYPNMQNFIQDMISSQGGEQVSPMTKESVMT